MTTSARLAKLEKQLAQISVVVYGMLHGQIYCDRGKKAAVKKRGR